MAGSLYEKICREAFAAGNAWSSSSMLATGRIVTTRGARLRLPLDQSIQQQQDHCAHDRHDPAGGVIRTHKHATDPRAYECPGDADQDRYDETTGIFSGH